MPSHLQTGQRYWFPDGDNPFLPGCSIASGFHDYIIQESGYLHLNDRGWPYCTILEKEDFSGFDPTRTFDELEMGNLTREQLWRKYIAHEVRDLRKTFREIGWKLEYKLPPS